MNSLKTKKMNLRHTAHFALLAIAFALSGCATNGDPRDPLEPLNRGIYKFNDTVDKAVIKPVAQGYKAVLPNPIRTGVTNFFSNINDVFVAVNNVLQFKLNDAVSDVGRIIANTTFGVGGIFDVASNWGMEKHNEDFGQTLGYWGIGDGPFLMLPILGPSNVRDTVGLVAYFELDPVLRLHNIPERNSLSTLRFVNTRARMLDAEKVLDEAALDPYTFLRDAYIQHRRNDVYDGNPPREKLEDDTAPGPQSEADNPKPQAMTETPAMEPAAQSAKPVENAEAATPVEPAAEKTVGTETESSGLPALVAWLFRSGDAAGGQK